MVRQVSPNLLQNQEPLLGRSLARNQARMLLIMAYLLVYKA